MGRKNKKPKQIKPEIIDSLADNIPVREYRLYSASSQLPWGIPWGGTEFQCVVIASASFSGSMIPNLPVTINSKEPVYLVRRFRTNFDDSPPRKVDDCLYFKSDNNIAWSLHSKDSPDHHWHIMSGSGLGDLLQDHYLPSASAGDIDSYISEGANLDFKKPFE